MGKPPARWRHGELLLCPSADGHPPGLWSPKKQNEKQTFLAPPQKAALGLASRSESDKRVVITRHGDKVGFYLPSPRRRRESNPNYGLTTG